jgi:hypothetical protein
VSFHGDISDQDQLRLPTTRCTAPPHEFDKPGLRRCQEHTEALVEARELGELWDEYGLVGDIIVRVSFYLLNLFHFLLHFRILSLWYLGACGVTRALIGIER